MFILSNRIGRFREHLTQWNFKQAWIYIPPWCFTWICCWSPVALNNIAWHSLHLYSFLFSWNTLIFSIMTFSRTSCFFKICAWHFTFSVKFFWHFEHLNRIPRWLLLWWFVSWHLSRKVLPHNTQILFEPRVCSFSPFSIISSICTFISACDLLICILREVSF